MVTVDILKLAEVKVGEQNVRGVPLGHLAWFFERSLQSQVLARDIGHPPGHKVVFQDFFIVRRHNVDVQNRVKFPGQELLSRVRHQLVSELIRDH